MPIATNKLVYPKTEKEITPNPISFWRQSITKSFRKFEGTSKLRCSVEHFSKEHHPKKVLGSTHTVTKTNESDRG